MAATKTHQGYNLEEIFWWLKRLGKNISMRPESDEYRLVFSHKSCGTQELYGDVWTVACNAADALLPAINSADHVAREAFAVAFPESVSS